MKLCSCVFLIDQKQDYCPMYHDFLISVVNTVLHWMADVMYVLHMMHLNCYTKMNEYELYSFESLHQATEYFMPAHQDIYTHLAAYIILLPMHNMIYNKDINCNIYS